MLHLEAVKINTISHVLSCHTDPQLNENACYPLHTSHSHCVIKLKFACNGKGPLTCVSLPLINIYHRFKHIDYSIMYLKLSKLILKHYLTNLCFYHFSINFFFIISLCFRILLFQVIEYLITYSHKNIN